eukprot:TRINITY_DN1521_c0_g1_i1.p1 TRINITY_DN1521_c0_g1~~TRINITY_DN1521_c0_g1_i1.p1  ORF type:complete len:504 (+),score=102.28 TRINITY_DN1521_c0_g1_i1:27-1514(+)
MDETDPSIEDIDQEEELYDVLDAYAAAAAAVAAASGDSADEGDEDGDDGDDGEEPDDPDDADEENDDEDEDPPVGDEDDQESLHDLGEDGLQALLYTNTEGEVADEYEDDDDVGYRRVTVGDSDVVPYNSELLGSRSLLSPAPKVSRRLDDTFDSFDLRVVFIRGHTGFEESKEFPVRIGAIVAGRYQILEYVGSAAFSKAVQCVDLVTRRHVCIKIIKNNKDFLDQSLDEIKLLQYINAACDPDEKHVLRLLDYFYFKEHLFIVCELLRDNLYEFGKYNRESGDEPYFTLPRLQRITRQCLIALEFIHSLRLMHCDLKPENILIQNYARCDVKVIDFGSSCFVTDHLSSYVQSRSYRAPEVVLGLPYGQKIDMWSMGCILAELWTGRVLFQNDSIQSMLARIAGIVGPFPDEMLQRARYANKYFTREGIVYERRRRGAALLVPKRTSLGDRLHDADPLFVEFVGLLLKLNPDERPTATEALQHPWLTTTVYEES